MQTIWPGGVTAAKGFTANGVACGIRRNKDKRDLALIVSECECEAAAVYTQNRVKGAPLLVNREHLKNGKAKAIVCNSGIANTCAPNGVQTARKMCACAAKELGISPSEVLVASTGVIGPAIPMEPIRAAMPGLAAGLNREGGRLAAQAIMTTDTVPKEAATGFTVAGIPCVLGGMAKGSGMIAPNMATMLCFLTTDTAIRADMLQKALNTVCGDTFNMLSVDGDTSTNDNVLILANGKAGNPPITEEGEAFDTFCEGLAEVCRILCRMLAKDGEGASRLMLVEVTGAATKEIAKTVAKAVCRSALVKTAIHGADANFGRVLCAVGYSGAEIDVSAVSGGYRSRAGAITVCRNGEMPDFDEDFAKTVLSEDEVTVAIDLHAGTEKSLAYGCDLTAEYVHINGDYRS